MPRHKSKPWGDLNERQQKYLFEIYAIDQKNEVIAKKWAAKTLRSRPAEEWRWIKYGYDEDFRPTPLLDALQNLNLVDQGTGSTFKALESRNLIHIRHDKSLCGEVLFVRLTTKGRKLVRVATGEVRPKKLPTGTLREWHWRALAMAYRADQEGKEGIPQEGILGDFGGIYWNTWLRLKSYRINGEYEPLVREHEIRESTDIHHRYVIPRYVIQITEAGKQFYASEWKRYQNLYPEVDAPKPIVPI